MIPELVSSLISPGFPSVNSLNVWSILDDGSKTDGTVLDISKTICLLLLTCIIFLSGFLPLQPACPVEDPQTRLVIVFSKVILIEW